MSKSKAKHAENLIKLVRTDVARLERFYQQQAKKNKTVSSRRWWNLLKEVEESLNSKPIVVDGRKVSPFTPKDVTEANLPDFLQALYKAKPAAYFAQFQVAPQFATFKYSVGTEVRPKLLATSSQLLGVKHSETNLKNAVYKIVENIPYVTSDLSVGQSYR